VKGFDAVRFQVVSCHSLEGRRKDGVNPRQDRQSAYDVTLWRFRAIVALEMQQSVSLFFCLRSYSNQ